MTKLKKKYKPQPYFRDYEDAYKYGVREGEKRLARALKRFAKPMTKHKDYLMKFAGRCILDWLAARLKEKK